MFIRAMHSPAARVVRALVGFLLFVRAGLDPSLLSIGLMAVGSLLIITAGADVCLLEEAGLALGPTPAATRIHDVPAAGARERHA